MITMTLVLSVTPVVMAGYLVLSWDKIVLWREKKRKTLIEVFVFLIIIWVIIMFQLVGKAIR